MTHQALATKATNPSVFIHDGKPVTTSMSVAEYFSKRHDNVIQKIERIDCSNEFRFLNFKETTYLRENPNGGSGITTKSYEMTKDGFIFLVMGFTGKKAAQFKEAYIAEFNRMESELLSPKKSTVDQRTPLRDAVNLLVSKKGLMYPEAYSIVHQRFNVASIEELQPEQLPVAIEYIHRLALEGEYLPKEAPREITHIRVHKDIDVHNVNALAKHFEAIYTAWKVELYPALHSVDPPIASRLYDRFKDGYSFLMRLQESLNGKHPALIN